MANEKFVRIDPRNHIIDRHVFGKGDADFITHTPRALSESDAKKVLDSQYRGRPLAVEVTKTEGQKAAEAAKAEVEAARAGAAEEAEAADNAAGDES